MQYLYTLKRFGIGCDDSTIVLVYKYIRFKERVGPYVMTGFRTENDVRPVLVHAQ